MASTSPPVTATPAIGDERNPSRGCRCGAASICNRRSGAAFRTNQSLLLADTASEACVRACAALSPCRARLQPGAFEFHCGKPPPAAEPRTTARTIGLPRRIRRRRRVESLFDLGAGVRVDLQPDGDLDDDGCLPLHGHFPRSFILGNLRPRRCRVNSKPARGWCGGPNSPTASVVTIKL